MIIKQKWIMREDLQNNPDFTYVFGDNLRRQGMGGQAKEMRNEPNAVGVATKKSPSNDPTAFFTDDEFNLNCITILNDFSPVIKKIMDGGVIVIPADGLGTGLSALEEHAPRTNKALNDILSYIIELDQRLNEDSV